jgi:hypothetical protein
MNEESSVSSRAAAAVTFIIAKCFSVESSECPKRDNALAAASSLPLLTSHHGDLFEIRKVELRIGGTDSHKWCNENRRDAEAPLCNKEATVRPLGGLGSQCVRNENSDEGANAKGYIARSRH